MSTETWVQTVEVGEELSGVGLSGMAAHDASLADAILSGAVKAMKDGREIDIEEIDRRGLNGVDLIRAK